MLNGISVCSVRESLDRLKGAKRRADWLTSEGVSLSVLISRNAPSFPLYSTGGLAGDIQRYPVDAADLVDNAVAGAFEQVVWQAGPVSGHRVV